MLYLVSIQLFEQLRQRQERVKIDQYIPTGDKNQKIWYLELLDSQLAQADAITNKLIAFLSKLQIDIQGSLTSAAMVKATSIELAE